MQIIRHTVHSSVGMREPTSDHAQASTRPRAAVDQNQSLDRGFVGWRRMLRRSVGSPDMPEIYGREDDGSVMMIP